MPSRWRKFSLVARDQAHAGVILAGSLQVAGPGPRTRTCDAAESGGLKPLNLRPKLLAWEQLAGQKLPDYMDV